jgi:uncharacterized protein
LNHFNYLDTSFVAAYLLPEPNSDRVETILHSLPAGSLKVSHWTGTEMASLLACKVRMQELSSHDSHKVKEIYDSLISDRVFGSVDIIAEDFQKASHWVIDAQLGLRGPDGLHLAIAHRLDVTIWSLDLKMNEIADRLGIKTG